ncbi:hypothetical protein BHM03_00005574 [Ensete ventricosum]|nr:hypothetical protein BHM03_00005574 [Ensete ventricosum]
MRSVFGDPKKAPPLVEKLTAEGLISILWKGEGSLVEDLLHSMAPHVEADLLSDLKSKIQAHDPSGSDNIQSELRKSLLWQEKDPQRPWPKDRIWVFKSNPKFFGSPMLDAVLNKCPLDKEMMHWLKTRPSVFQVFKHLFVALYLHRCSIVEESKFVGEAIIEICHQSKQDPEMCNLLVDTGIVPLLIARLLKHHSSIA